MDPKAKLGQILYADWLSELLQYAPVQVDLVQGMHTFVKKNIVNYWGSLFVEFLPRNGWIHSFPYIFSL